MEQFEPGHTADPHPRYAELRDTTPVRRVVSHGLDGWLLTRHDDVRAALGDTRLSTNPDHASPASRQSPGMAGAHALGLDRDMLRADDPAHARLRGLVGRAFTTGRVESLRPRLQQRADDLIDGFAGEGRADLIEDFAFPMTAVVIMELIGVPGERRRDFDQWIRMGVEPRPDQFPLVPGAWASIRAFITELIEAKRSLPGDDLLTELLTPDTGGECLTAPELCNMLILLLTAGYTTTLDLIGNGMYTLLSHPGQLAALLADPALTGAAVDEILRFEGSVEQGIIRFATEDLSLRGMHISRGDPVMACLAAANRDPRRFRDPDTFDIRRDEAGSVAFGHGIHRCLGAPLAQMEGQVAIATLLRRLPGLALAVPPGELIWRRSQFLRGLQSLPVAFTPETGGTGS
jgi:cytochrome P450